VQEGGETVYSECSKTDFDKYVLSRIELAKQLSTQKTALERQISQFKYTQETNTIPSPNVRTGIKYIFHNQSIFARYFGMGLKSATLYPFVQKPECKHSFGCLEHFIRKVAYNSGLFIIGRYFYEMFSPEGWKFDEVIKDFGKNQLKLSKTITGHTGFSFVVQVLLVIGISIYGIRKCLKKPKEETQAQKPEPTKPKADIEKKAVYQPVAPAQAVANEQVAIQVPALNGAEQP
jgi:hypothetical protein